MKYILVLLNYCRRLIPRCSTIVKRLTELTVSVLFQLNCVISPLNVLTQTLASAPVLTPFDPHDKVLLTTDLLQFEIGIVIEQLTEKEIQMVAHTSRTPNAAECNYAANARILVAVVESALCVFGAYLDTVIHQQYLQIITH